jgi:hypothetical protein
MNLKRTKYAVTFVQKFSWSLNDCSASIRILSVYLALKIICNLLLYTAAVEAMKR